MTQEELANRSGYSKRTIERIERGELSRPTTMHDIATTLGLEIDIAAFGGT